MTDEKLLERIKNNGEYLAVRELEDGTIIALGDLMYTRAIMIDCDVCGYARRYCFEDKIKAIGEFAKLKSGDDEPQGYVAKRPKD